MVILKLTLYSTGTASREYSQSIHIGHRHEKWLEPGRDSPSGRAWGQPASLVVVQ
jgi:hypothetical protein